MKCIQAVKQTKEHSIGDIIRVDDKTAFNMVGTFWKYVSKSEWKSSKTTGSEPSTDQVPTKYRTSCPIRIILVRYGLVRVYQIIYILIKKELKKS